MATGGEAWPEINTPKLFINDNPIHKKARIPRMTVISAAGKPAEVPRKIIEVFPFMHI